MHFSDTISGVEEVLNLTDKELAERADVSPKTIWSYKNSGKEANPEWITVTKFFDNLGFDLESLLFLGTGEQLEKAFLSAFPLLLKQANLTEEQIQSVMDQTVKVVRTVALRIALSAKYLDRDLKSERRRRFLEANKKAGVTSRRI